MITNISKQVLGRSIYWCSDLHFGHTNIIKYTRRQFNNIDEHDEYIIDRWNSVVDKNDLVYICGDVTLNPKHLYKLHRLNGTKKLILGNHDIKVFKNNYSQYFKSIYGAKYFWFEGIGKVVATHIPVYQDEFKRSVFNIHGHVHHNLLKNPRYINVCMEHIDFTPVHYDQLIACMRKRLKE